MNYFEFISVQNGTATLRACLQQLSLEYLKSTGQAACELDTAIRAVDTELMRMEKVLAEGRQK